MKNLWLIPFLGLLSACTSHPKIETENSPCACYYNGEQLKQPTPEQLDRIVEQANEHRAA